MGSRKVDIVILKLTSEEFEKISLILEHSNKTLKRSREKAELKKKTEVRQKYRREFIHLEDFISQESRIRLRTLHDERAKWRELGSISEDEELNIVGDKDLKNIIDEAYDKTYEGTIKSNSH